MNLNIIMKKRKFREEKERVKIYRKLSHDVVIYKIFPYFEIVASSNLFIARKKMGDTRTQFVQRGEIKLKKTIEYYFGYFGGGTGDNRNVYLIFSYLKANSTVYCESKKYLKKGEYLMNILPKKIKGFGFNFSNEFTNDLYHTDFSKTFNNEFAHLKKLEIRGISIDPIKWKSMKSLKKFGLDNINRRLFEFGPKFTLPKLEVLLLRYNAISINNKLIKWGNILKNSRNLKKIRIMAHVKHFRRKYFNIYSFLAKIPIKVRENIKLEVHFYVFGEVWGNEYGENMEYVMRHWNSLSDNLNKIKKTFPTSEIAQMWRIDNRHYAKKYHYIFDNSNKSYKWVHVNVNTNCYTNQYGSSFVLHELIKCKAIIKGIVNTSSGPYQNWEFEWDESAPLVNII